MRTPFFSFSVISESTVPVAVTLPVAHQIYIKCISEEVAGILLDGPEGGANQGFHEAKEVRWRGAAKLGRETSSPTKRGLTKTS